MGHTHPLEGTLAFAFLLNFDQVKMKKDVLQTRTQARTRARRRALTKSSLCSVQNAGYESGE